ncbi:hypothetical protein [Paenibacillus alkalitolerans]|uniref:hypothetical protein n=1 Tax=Paenibacillus alkalitolerans TaxID=2799335 RepID=UPI0018F4368D|nr:hypothetical protein [Paenibacillus alkalitolerans]
MRVRECKRRYAKPLQNKKIYGSVPMVEELVTCKSVGVYQHALTRGKQYEVVDSDNEKYRVVGDHGKRIWIEKSYFRQGSVALLMMSKWKFDQDVKDNNFVEITIRFNDGSSRWCNITTPDNIKKHFEIALLDPPGMIGNHMIIMKSFNEEEIEKTLRYFDSQGELECITKPLV